MTGKKPEFDTYAKQRSSYGGKSSVNTHTRKGYPLWPFWVSTILGLITITTLVVQITKPVTANDLWWHMALGRHILDSGSLIVDHSIFTWTPATSYHIYNSWLADIILYLTYDHTGTTGLITLRYSVFFLLFLLAWLYALTRRIARNPITWVVLMVALSLVWPAHLIKPELFTVGFFTIVVWLYFHMRYHGDNVWWLAYLFPLILVIWVNMHGAFFISSIFFAAAGVGEIMNSRFCPSQAMSSRLKRHFFIALALCFPAILISPFGYELPLNIIRDVLTQEGLIKHVVSYKPTFEFNGSPLYMLDYMIMAMLLFVLLLWQKMKRRQTDWVVILAFLGYSTIFTQIGRVAFFLGPVFLFSCLDLLAEKKDSWAWPLSKMNKTMLITLCISAIAFIGWRTVNDNSCKLLGLRDNIKRAFSTSTSFPIAETEFIKNNLPGMKVGNIYKDGGYLLYHLWPEKQVMIDPRYFPFKDWFDSYVAFSKGINIEQFTKRNPADYWLINYNNPAIFQWFYQSNDWKPALLGVTGTIFLPSNSFEEEPIISPELATMMEFGDINSAFIVAIQLNDLAFAKRILEVAQNDLECTCDQQAALIREMADMIAGFQAYNNGNYEETARILETKSWSSIALNKATRALTVLAERSWNRGEILGARNWYLKILKIQSPKTITEIYNFTLLDWHYRHSDGTNLENTNGDLHWQKFVDIILAQKDKIHQSQQHIVETVMAMKEERYDSTAQLIPHTSGHSPIIHSKQKSQTRIRQ